MKNKHFVAGILVFVLVFGMMVVGCKDGSTDGGAIASLGPEDFYYLDYIPASDHYDVTFATVRLPGTSSEGYDAPPRGYFTNFKGHLDK
jgi:hypothetical protein